MNFKVGDKVKIKEGNRFYGINKSNPANISGVIMINSLPGNLPIRVNWSNHTSNKYNENDLVLVNIMVPIKQLKKHRVM